MYRLTRGAEKLPTPPVLDPAQRAVVEHAGGPLLVLAGPGTGKTTTLVECVVDRIERRNATADSILVLTFSRKAAADLRTRIAARLGRTTVAPMAMTFHAFCYALVRRFADDGGGVDTPGFGTPAAAADRTGAGVPGAGDAPRQPGDPTSSVARSARSSLPHSGIRRRGTGRAGQGTTARDGSR